MKNIVKATSIALVALSLGSIAAPNILSASANTTQSVSSSTTNSVNDANDLTPYVVVKNNQYKLEVPSNVLVPMEVRAEAQEVIDSQNSVVAEAHATINPETKTATFMASSDTNSSSMMLMAAAKSKYHQGVNKFTVHWNYIRVYIKKSTLNGIKTGTIGAASAVAGAKIKNIYAVAAAGAIGALAGNINIKGGIWVDYNFFAKNITKWGWQ